MSQHPARARVLLSEKAPYVLTLTVALLGWTVKHTGDRLASTPVIEYACVKVASPSGQESHCTITNLSSSTLQALHFSQVPKDRVDAICGADIKWHLPITQVTGEPAKHDFTPASAEYQVPYLPPGGTITLTACTRGPAGANLLISAKTGVAMKESSVITFFLRYELQALFVLAAVGLTLLAGLLIGMSRAPVQEVEESARFE